MRQEFLIKTRYIDDHGLHIVNECLSTFLVASIVPKGSAFLTVFNNIITRVVESGLTLKWNEDIINSMIIEKGMSLGKKKTRVRAFCLQDVQGAFFVIILGYGCSMLVFLCEVWYHNKKCQERLSITQKVNQ
jgi:hypothetical protein